MADARKKPLKLEFETRIVSSDGNASESVKVRGSDASSSSRAGRASTDSSAIALKGSVKLRREVKGRAGKPVSVLFGFSDSNASQAASLKALQAQLKESLACGGTFDEAEGTIVLQVDDLKRVRSVLEKLGFDVKG
jgi:translation initiation factor 1 (eIF-1/SUI1)